MDVKNYRQSLPRRSTRAAFLSWLNTALEPYGKSISVSYLRDLEYGRKVPSLELAIVVADVTNGVVSVADWPGLQDRLSRNKAAAKAKALTA